MNTELNNPATLETPVTLRRLNEKIAYQQSHKKKRSALPGRQPTRCPDCEETWVGLARRGSCPACGLVYDENTRAWSGRRGVRLGTPILVTLLSILLVVMYVDVWWLVAPVAILVPVFWAWTIYDYLISRDGRFIATTPAGVVCRIRSHKTRTIPWGLVIFAEATAYRMPVFKVHGKKRAVRIRVNKAIRNCRDGCEFATAVEDGLKRYSTSVSQPPNGEATRG